jgi:hypothetical protein
VVEGAKVETREWGIETRECEPPGGSRLRCQLSTTWESNFLRKSFTPECGGPDGNVKDGAPGGSCVTKTVTGESGRQTSREINITVEDHLRASRRLAFETPVFDDAGKSVFDGTRI